MLGNNSKDIVAIGNAMLSDDEENSEWSDHLKIKITTIVNAGQITEEMIRKQNFQKGQTVFWPRRFVGTPVRIVAANQTQPKDSDQRSTREPPTSGSVDDSNNEDRVYNYGTQVMQLGTFFMQMDDTKCEGDGERMMRNWKLLMLYARCTGRSKKYAFEAMRLLTYCRALLSEKMAHRVIHGQFVNPSGGKGKNYANDLKQEHLVKCNKVILRGLCGNKTLKAVTRSTQSAYNVKKITVNFGNQTNIKPESHAGLENVRQRRQRRCQEIFHKITRRKFFCISQEIF